MGFREEKKNPKTQIFENGHRILLSSLPNLTKDQDEPAVQDSNLWFKYERTNKNSRTK